MVSIQLDKTGKKFGREWIFRKLDLDIPASARLAILGSNGSGKSTLLQVIAGYITPNEGRVTYKRKDHAIAPEQINDHLSFASPYLQLIEDFTGTELITHVSKFKPFRKNMAAAEVLEISGLSPAGSKFIGQYSSGMKQRLRLALALLADTPVVLLDEPSSNLDAQAMNWYKSMVAAYSDNRTLIVCSNAIAHEYDFCTQTINLSDYKN